MKSDSFEHTFIVTLKDVNLYGTVYFARYFEWQGVSRELYLMTVDNFHEVLSGITMVTKFAWNDYKKQIFPFDEVLVRIQNRNIKKSSFEMIFTYFNKKSGEIFSVGGETLIFVDNKGSILRIPEGIKKVISKHIYIE
jgi:enediyne biosynthesis thioesterase